MNPFSERIGSSRPAALFRIGVVLLLWTRFGGDLTPHDDTAPDMLVLQLVFWCASSALFVGLWTPVAAVWVAASSLYLFFGLGVFGTHEEWVSHHVWVLVSCAALLPLMPSGRSYSLDRWLALRRGDAVPERGWPGGMRLVALQLTAIYFWTAVDKTSAVFLSGDRLQAIFLDLYFEALPTDPWVGRAFQAVAIATVLFEYVLAFGIHVRRLQPWLLPAGILLHVVFHLLLPVSVFSANMVLMYLALLDPDAVHRFIDRMHGAGAPEGEG